mmetsp:Transcript_51389/g.124068  ORF Transcript_51389/g.124068 Transcript_51389/m.124068 type:complete len:98 (-) Transcript_51389:217-510(-)
MPRRRRPIIMVHTKIPNGTTTISIDVSTTTKKQQQGLDTQHNPEGSNIQHHNSTYSPLCHPPSHTRARTIQANTMVEIRVILVLLLFVGVDRSYAKL